jgi:hypothetical protein
MKLKVLKEFYDRYTGLLHEAGETIEADENRLKEIQSVSARLVEVEPEEVAADTEAVKSPKKKKKVTEEN